jgi:hypothetical protein
MDESSENFLSTIESCLAVYRTLRIAKRWPEIDQRPNSFRAKAEDVTIELALMLHDLNVHEKLLSCNELFTVESANASRSSLESCQLHLCILRDLLHGYDPRDSATAIEELVQPSPFPDTIYHNTLEALRKISVQLAGHNDRWMELYLKKCQRVDTASLGRSWAYVRLSQEVRIYEGQYGHMEVVKAQLQPLNRLSNAGRSNSLAVMLPVEVIVSNPSIYLTFLAAY